MYITETTGRERVILENALDGAFVDLDRAHVLLLDAIDLCWGDWEQKDIKAHDAEHVGVLLHVAADIVFDALLQYHLTVGNDWWRGVGPYLEGARRAEAAIKTTQADKKAWEMQRRAGAWTEGAAKTGEARKLILGLPDDQAAPLLEDLVSR